VARRCSVQARSSAASFIRVGLSWRSLIGNINPRARSSRCAGGRGCGRLVGALARIAMARVAVMRRVPLVIFIRRAGLVAVIPRVVWACLGIVVPLLVLSAGIAVLRALL